MSIFILCIIIWILGTGFLFLWSFYEWLKSSYLKIKSIDKDYVKFLKGFDSEINNLLNN